MKILVTGVAGQLGHDVMNELAKRGYEGVGSDIAPEYAGAQDGTAVTTMPYVSMDITDADVVKNIITEVHPDVVIHCAAMTAVDRCETEKELAYKLNVEGSGNVAKACRKHGVRLIAVSTDYVFDGKAERPYNEFDIADGGATVYGQSKFYGEEAVKKNCKIL